MLNTDYYCSIGSLLRVKLSDNRCRLLADVNRLVEIWKQLDKGVPVARYYHTCVFIIWRDPKYIDFKAIVAKLKSTLVRVIEYECSLRCSNINPLSKDQIDGLNATKIALVYVERLQQHIPDTPHNPCFISPTLKRLTVHLSNQVQWPSLENGLEYSNITDLKLVFGKSFTSFMTLKKCPSLKRLTIELYDSITFNTTQQGPGRKGFESDIRGCACNFPHLEELTISNLHSGRAVGCIKDELGLCAWTRLMQWFIPTCKKHQTKRIFIDGVNVHQPYTLLKDVREIKVSNISFDELFPFNTSQDASNVPGLEDISEKNQPLHPVVIKSLIIDNAFPLIPKGIQEATLDLQVMDEVSLGSIDAALHFSTLRSLRICNVQGTSTDKQKTNLINLLSNSLRLKELWIQNYNSRKAAVLQLLRHPILVMGKIDNIVLINCFVNLTLKHSPKTLYIQRSIIPNIPTHNGNISTELTPHYGPRIRRPMRTLHLEGAVMSEYSKLCRLPYQMEVFILKEDHQGLPSDNQRIWFPNLPEVVGQLEVIGRNKFFTVDGEDVANILGTGSSTKGAIQ